MNLREMESYVISQIFTLGKTQVFIASKPQGLVMMHFVQYIKKNRNCFNVVLGDAGFGIGVDYGQVGIVKVADSITVVGFPVVYACRLGGAPVGMIYTNQSAYEKLSNDFGENLKFREVNHILKMRAQ